MEAENRKICRPDSPTDGPMDGVQMKADCIRTDFIDNPNEKEGMFTQRDKSEAHISASAEIGIFSIRDLESGVMLTVSLQNAMELLAAAVDAAREAGECIERTSGSAEVADSE